MDREADAISLEAIIAIECEIAEEQAHEAEEAERAELEWAIQYELEYGQ